jgi:hypothetical protein
VDILAPLSVIDGALDPRHHAGIVEGAGILQLLRQRRPFLGRQFRKFSFDLSEAHPGILADQCGARNARGGWILGVASDRVSL